MSSNLTLGTSRRGRRTVSGKTRAVVRERMAALRRRSRPVVGQPRKTTVGDYLAQWLDNVQLRVRPSTRRGRKLSVEQYIVPTLGGLALA